MQDEYPHFLMPPEAALLRTRQAAQHSTVWPSSHHEVWIQAPEHHTQLGAPGLRQLPALCPSHSSIIWLCSWCAMRF